jgi:hypothetical protein
MRFRSFRAFCIRRNRSSRLPRNSGKAFDSAGIQSVVPYRVHTRIRRRRHRRVVHATMAPRAHRTQLRPRRLLTRTRPQRRPRHTASHHRRRRAHRPVVRHRLVQSALRTRNRPLAAEARRPRRRHRTRLCSHRHCVVPGSGTDRVSHLLRRRPHQVHRRQDRQPRRQPGAGSALIGFGERAGRALLDSGLGICVRPECGPLSSAPVVS